MPANEPAPMTRESYERPAGDVAPHDHAVCVYDTHAELRRPLGVFLERGVEREALSVFVHSFGSDAEAWDFLDAAYPGASDLREDQLVVVSLYRDAFQGAAERIDYDHVLRVVEGLVRAAEEQGRSGTRIFVDASRIYFSEKRAEEWFAFESWLGRRLHHAVGLVCAYQRSDATRPELFGEMLRTHAYRFDVVADST